MIACSPLGWLASCSVALLALCARRYRHSVHGRYTGFSMAFCNHHGLQSAAKHEHALHTTHW